MHWPAGCPYVMNEEFVQIRDAADPADPKESAGRAAPNVRDEPLEVFALSQFGPAPLCEPWKGPGRTRHRPATRSRSLTTMCAARSPAPTIKQGRSRGAEFIEEFAKLEAFLHV